jgi:hypothetical protein
MPNVHPIGAPTVIGSVCSGPGAGGGIIGACEDDPGTGTQRAHPCASQEDTSEALIAAADDRTSNGGIYGPATTGLKKSNEDGVIVCGIFIIMSCNVLYVKY